MALDDTTGGDDGDDADSTPLPQQGHQQTSHTTTTTTTAMAPAVQEDPVAAAAAVSVSSVEEYVRRHYLQQGFEGYHCENRLFMTLYGLLFWDVIHGALQAEQRSGIVAAGPNAADAAAAAAVVGSADDDGATSAAAVVVVEEAEDKEEAARSRAGAVADMDTATSCTSTVPFTSAYQDTPHDLHHGSEFISRRREAVAATLAAIEEEGEEGGGRGMERLLREAFHAHYGEQSRYVQWDWRDAQLQSAKMKSSRASGGGADDRGGRNAVRSAAAGDARTPAGLQEEQEEEQDPAQLQQRRRQEEDEEVEEVEEEEDGLKASKAVALAELIGLCRGLGSRAVAGMCRLYAESYETWAGGLPDLLIWRPPRQQQHAQQHQPSDAAAPGTTAVGTAPSATAVSAAAGVELAAGAWDVRLVEVKGPGDSLSHRQRAWIDRLLGWGCPFASAMSSPSIIPKVANIFNSSCRYSSTSTSHCSQPRCSRCLCVLEESLRE